jgi:hypothetical protein
VIWLKGALEGVKEEEICAALGSILIFAEVAVQHHRHLVLAWDGYDIAPGSFTEVLSKILWMMTKGAADEESRHLCTLLSRGMLSFWYGLSETSACCAAAHPHGVDDLRRVDPENKDLVKEVVGAWQEMSTVRYDVMANDTKWTRGVQSRTWGAGGDSRPKWDTVLYEDLLLHVALTRVMLLHERVTLTTMYIGEMGTVNELEREYYKSEFGDELREGKLIEIVYRC